MRTFRSYGIACSLGLVLAWPSFATTRYVDVASPAPDAPYTNWTHAARSIQAAINVASNGDQILVAPGTYLSTGSALLIPEDKTLTLRSTQSRAAIIDAQGLSQGLVVYGTNSLVEGFTLRHGVMEGSYGGGMVLVPPCMVRDCLVVSNRANGAGGIMFFGPAVVENCTIQGNQATNSIGGGVVFYDNSQGLLRNCVISDNVALNEGGGIYFQQGATVSNCWISGNRSTTQYGGGLYMTPEANTNGGGKLVNSVVVGNRAEQAGGGVYCSGPTGAPSSVINCTIVSNTAGGAGGGISVHGTRVVNCILYHNSAPAEENLQVRVPSTVVISNCCVTPDYGVSNFTNAPSFVNAAAQDYHLATASFCIDAGTTNFAPSTDYDGSPRPRVGLPKADIPDPLPPKVDVGAFEYGFHFNAIRSTGTNAVQLVWDVQDRGIYKLDALTNHLPATNWLQNIGIFTNSVMAPGQFSVHTQTVVIPTPVPANAIFRLRVSHTIF